MKRALTEASCQAGFRGTSHSVPDHETGFTQMLLDEAVGLRRYARRLTASAVDAEDLVQDTLLRCWRWQSGYERGTNFVGWTRTVMRNSFFTGQKRHRREVDVPDDVLDLIRTVDPAQSFALELREAREAIARLPDQQRRAVLLASEGTSVQDGAAALAIPANTYKSLVRRGRERLTRMVGEQPPTMTPPAPIPVAVPPREATRRRAKTDRRKLIIG